MSDLQTSLLIIGAFVVAGVYMFNVWQERQFRRRAEQAFAGKHDDVLLREPPNEPNTQEAITQVPVERVEPTLQESAAARPLDAMSIRPAALFDPLIDYVVEVTVPNASHGTDLHAELRNLCAGWNKAVVAAGYDAASGIWRAAGVDDDADYPQLRFALQMSDRAGSIQLNQLTAFREAVVKWAERNQGVAQCPDAAEAHARAVQLDRFCSEVDIAIGINVVTADGHSFSGTKIRALAESAGMKLEPDGVFYARNDIGNTWFTLDNHEPMPFVPEQIKTLSTRGVTFLLDVPRVENALQAFDAMLEVARNFSSTLDGILVDDNRAALSDDAIAKIRRHLESVLTKMEAGQIAAGGARALRLFS